MSKSIFGCWLLFIISVCLALFIGETPVHLRDLLSLRMTPETEILWQVRFPRAVCAALSGAFLGAAGVLTQGLFRNPLASPHILGVTSGASCFAAVTFFLGAAAHAWYVLPIAALCGAFFALTLVLAFLLRPAISLGTLLLFGFSLSAIFGAFTTLVINLSMDDPWQFQALQFWLLGGLSARSWDHVLMGAVPGTLGLLLAGLVVRPLDVLTLGEDVASSMGVNLHRLKRVLVVAVALLEAAAVSMVGAIAFVGLIVPHITRLWIGAASPRLLRYALLNGASLLLLADTAARTLRAPGELQVGVLITLLGAPFFLVLLLQQEKRGAIL